MIPALQFLDASSIIWIDMLLKPKRIFARLGADECELVIDLGDDKHVIMKPGEWVYPAANPVGFDVGDCDPNF